MLEPFWLTKVQRNTYGFQWRKVLRFVGRVLHGEEDIDHRLCGKPRYRCGTHMLEQQHFLPEYLTNLASQLSEYDRPLGIVSSQMNPGHRF